MICLVSEEDLITRAGGYNLIGHAKVTILHPHTGHMHAFLQPCTCVRPSPTRPYTSACTYAPVINIAVTVKSKRTRQAWTPDSEEAARK